MRPETKPITLNLNDYQRFAGSLRFDARFASIVLISNQPKYFEELRTLCDSVVEVANVNSPHNKIRRNLKLEEISIQCDRLLMALQSRDSADIPDILLLPGAKKKVLIKFLKELSWHSSLDKVFAHQGRARNTANRYAAKELIRLFRKYSLPILKTQEGCFTLDSLFNVTLRGIIKLIGKAPQNVNQIWADFVSEDVGVDETSNKDSWTISFSSDPMIKLRGY